MVVEIKLGQKDARIISGYGPQENWSIEERTPFFNALEEEIVKAKTNDKLVYIQMDANCKLGPHIIEGDTHSQSENGKILSGIFQRNALSVINSSKEKCKGKFTRVRSTKHNQEQSIIDFVIGCEMMSDMITELVIDEEKLHALTSYRKTKTGPKVIQSDHNSMITQVQSVWHKKVPKERTEMYNLKDKEGLKKFKDITSKDTFLSEVFTEGGKVERQTKIFLKRLNYCLSLCFKKIRLHKSKKNKELEELFAQRRILRNKKI